MEIKNIFYIITAFSFINNMILSRNIYSDTFIAAYINQENPKKATQILEKVIIESSSITPYAQLIKSYFATRNFTKIITIVKSNKKILNLIIDNPKIGLLVVKTFIAIKNNQQAMDLLIKLNNKYPANQEIAFLTAQLYEQKKEIQNALTVSQNYLNKVTNKPSNFAFNFLNARLHRKLNDNDEALKSINRSLAQQKNFDLGWLIFAELKEKSNQAEDKTDAIKGYTRYLEISQSPRGSATNNPFIIKTVENRLLNLSFKQSISKHPAQSKSKVEYCQLQAIKLFKEKKYKNALTSLDKCLSQKNVNNEEKKLFKIQIFSQMQKYEQILQLLALWIEQEPTNELWHEILYLLHHTPIDSHKIVQVALKAEKQRPENISIKLHIADHYLKMKKEKKAISYLKKAVPSINNQELKETVLYNISLIYYNLKNYKKAQQILKPITTKTTKITKTTKNIDIFKHLAKINQKLNN